jgi:hypothetical protein
LPFLGEPQTPIIFIDAHIYQKLLNLYCYYILFAANAKA